MSLIGGTTPTRKSLRNIKVLTEALPAPRSCPANALQGIKCGESWHQSKCSRLSPSHTEVSLSMGKSSSALYHLSFPSTHWQLCRYLHSKRNDLFNNGWHIQSCEFEPWNGSHRQSPCWWRADTRWRSLELLHWLRQLLVWDAGM